MKFVLRGKEIFLKKNVIIIAVTFLLVVAPIVCFANVFYNVGALYYSNGGVKTNGDSTTPNAYALGVAYRSNIANQLSTDERVAFNIPAGGNPAFYSWDCGSSDWPSYPQEGEPSMTVFETRNGLLDWTGSSWVAGDKHLITITDLGNSETNHGVRTVMEPIPAPVIDAAGTDESHIKIKWTGLWDNDQGGPGGSSNNSVVSYSIYRNVNGGAYQAHGSPYAVVAQNAGAQVSYTDNSVSLGNTYKYKITVNFEWNNHTPTYYETTAEGPESAGMQAIPPEPDRIAFSSAAKTITAGTTSSIITIETRDSSGSAANVTSDTTISLSSNSTSANKKFYSVSAGACTSTEISQVVVTTGNSTAQFCYYDEAKSNPTWTLTAHKSDPATPTWLDGTQSVTVNASSTVSSVRIDNAPDGSGSEITTHTMTADDTFTMYAVSFDQYGNAIGNISVTWSSSGLTPALSGTGTSKTFSPTTAPASGNVSIDDGSGHTDSTGTITVNPGAAATFTVIAPASATAGTSFNLTSITAKDADGNTATGYNGAKTLSYSGPSNGSESGSPSYTTDVNFTNGVATTTLATMLVKAETVKITATQGSISGQSEDIVVSGSSPTHLHVSAPATATAGVSFNLTSITAHDAYGNVATSYSGGKTINYSGPSAGPLGDNPSYTTSVNFTDGVSDTALATTLFKRESAVITANDGTYSGVSENISVGAGTAGSIEYVSGDNQTGVVSQNLANPLVVRVLDIFGNNKDGYTVQWTVTGGDGSVLPSSSITASDGTTQTAWKIGPYAGSSINGAEARATGLFGSPVLFSATGESGEVHLLEVDAPLTVTAGEPFDIIIRAVDFYGNIVTSFTGSQTVSYSGPGNSSNGDSPTYSTNVSFASGVANNISTTLVKAETVILTATIGSYEGSSLLITVLPGPTDGLRIASPTPQIVGVPFNLTSIRSIDEFGNYTSDYSGSKTLSYSNAGTGPSGQVPSFTTAVSFEDGVSTTVLTTILVKPEIVILHVTDGTYSGDSNPISVGYNEPYVLTYVSGNNQTGAVGSQLANPLVVMVVNSSGLPVIGETVHFSTSGGALSTTDATVDVDGYARTYLTLGSEEGTYIVTATVTGIATVVTFNETAVMTGAARLIFSTVAQQVKISSASKVITVCLSDSYGNTMATGSDRAIGLASSSSTGTFSNTASGPWTLSSLMLASGESCVNFYYKDSTSGVFTLTASSSGLTSATQSIFISEESAETVVQEITNITNKTTKEGDIIKEETVTNEGSFYLIIINNYYSSPSGSSSQTSAISVPQSPFPVILSPRQGSLIHAFDSEVVIAGTAISDSIVVLYNDRNEIIGSSTADARGSWRMHISADKITQGTLRIIAGIYSTELKSSPVMFNVKKDSSWMKKLLRMFNLY